MGECGREELELASHFPCSPVIRGCKVKEDADRKKYYF